MQREPRNKTLVFKAILIASILTLSGCPFGGKPNNPWTKKPLGSSPTAGAIDVSQLPADQVAALNEDRPSVVEGPADITVKVGESATFSVKAIGKQPMNYAWFRIEADTVTPVPGCSGNTCTLSMVKKTDAGRYSVEISNSLGGVSAVPATLTVEEDSAVGYFLDADKGNDSNPGTKDKPWKTLTYAVSKASPAPNGSTFFVKAGYYREAGVVVQKNGITISGYREKPNDSPLIIADSGHAIDLLTVTGSGKQATVPVVREMPVLAGFDRDGDTTGINVRGTTGVTIRNIAITGYLRGLVAGVPDRKFRENLSLNNVNVTYVGRTYGGEYGGLGISLGSMSTHFSNGDRVTNSFVLNPSSEGITFNGNDNLLEHSKVINNQLYHPQATDYFVMVSGSNNKIIDNYIETISGAEHGGHGFSIKSNAGALSSVPTIPSENNRFERNTSVGLNEGFVVRHRAVAHNVFVDNIARGNYKWGMYPSCESQSTGGDSPGIGADGTGIVIRDGAHDNTFTNTRIEDVCEAIVITDSREDEGPNGEVVNHANQGVGHPNENNIIDRATVRNAFTGIIFWHDVLPNGSGTVMSNAGNTTISNSVFEQVRFMFWVDRPADRMKYVNTTFSGTSDFVGLSAFLWDTYDGGYKTDVKISQFSNCTFTRFKGLPPEFQ